MLVDEAQAVELARRETCNALRDGIAGAAPSSIPIAVRRFV
ncbi:MAG TPA: hypothetical protein VIK68_10200 [Sphingomicrobium sp.]